MNFWITTDDNPFDPFYEWDSWFTFDEANGYRTCERLAKLAEVSSDCSDTENDLALARAINSLCTIYDGVYKMVVEDNTGHVDQGLLAKAESIIGKASEDQTASN